MSETNKFDLTTGLQSATETVIKSILQSVFDQNKYDNLCLSGGTVLNCVAAGKIKSYFPFLNEIYVTPTPHDGWLQRIIENGGHYARRFGKEDVIKWKSKEDNVFASLANGESSQILATKRELYEDYVMYCKDISKTHRGSENWLIRDLNDFCKLKKIEFRSGEKASFEGERTVIVFPGTEKLREQWIAGVYDGQDPFTDGDDLSDIDLDI